MLLKNSNENDTARARMLYTKRKRDAAGAMRITHLDMVRFYAHEQCSILYDIILFLNSFIANYN